ncbi:hypothetical protein GGI42DRAFT_29924 [Trichoderma sp. SZMC 28013]
MKPLQPTPPTTAESSIGDILDQPIPLVGACDWPLLLLRGEGRRKQSRRGKKRWEKKAQICCAPRVRGPQMLVCASIPVAGVLSECRHDTHALCSYGWLVRDRPPCRGKGTRAFHCGWLRIISRLSAVPLAGCVLVQTQSSSIWAPTEDPGSWESRLVCLYLDYE